MDIATAVRSIKTEGYVVVPNVLPTSLVRDLAAAIDELQQEDTERYGKEYLYKIGQEGFVINVGDRGEPFERLLQLRPAQPVVDAILEPGAFLYLFQGVIVPPGGGLGAYPWKWHCDLYHVMLDVHDRTFIPGVNCLFFVDDVNSDNGSTWIIPGSQGLLDEDVPWSDDEFLKRSTVQLQATAGSVVMFNPLLWHCAGVNRTDKPRRAVKMLMVREWMMPQMDYARSIRPEVLERLDSEASRLLGHRSRIPRSFAEMAEATI